MRANRFTVIIDACVLHSVIKRNIILSLAEAGLFRPRWNETILNEFEISLSRRFGDAEKAKLQRQRIEMAFPEGLVEIDEKLIDVLELPDVDDRHVLAAAIKSRAALIVTDNLKDFPVEQLEPHEITPVNADNFIADSISLAEHVAIAKIREMRARFNRPEIDAEALILKCEKDNMPETSKILSDYIELI